MKNRINSYILNEIEIDMIKMYKLDEIQDEKAKNLLNQINFH